MGSLSNRFAQRGATPVGTIIPSGAGSAPTGYLPCDGAAVSRTTYAALFSVLNTVFGAGDGSSTFNVPNTAGLFLRGNSSQVISAKTFDGGAVGNKQKDGTSVNGLSIGTVSTPTLSLANTDLTHTHGYSDLTTSFTTQVVSPGGGFNETMSRNPFNAQEADTTASALGNHTHTLTPSITNVVTTLSSSGTETRPAHVTVAFYIKY